MRCLSVVLPLAAVAAFSILLAQPAEGADDAAAWVGKRVVPKTGNLPLHAEPRDNAKSLGPITDAIVTVEQEGNGWIKVRPHAETGWIKADDCVPLDKALDYFTEAIRREPAVARNHNVRGVVRHAHGDVDGSLKDYDEAIRLAPRNAVFRMNRGTIWAEKKDYHKAIADYDEALQLNPRYDAAFHFRAVSWLNLKENDKAIADENEAIKLQPKYTLAYAYRGNAWNAKKDYDKAIADYSEASKLDPHLAWPLNNRGNAWKSKHEYDKALADYDASIKVDAKYAMGYSNRAWLLATCTEDKVRDGKKAVESARKACELSNWKNATFVGTFAAAQAEAGDFAEAIKWEKKAIELLPADNKQAHDTARQRLQMYEDGKPFRQR